MTFAADMFASSVFSDYNLPYDNITTFLEAEMEKEDPLIIGYSYTGKRFDLVFDEMMGGSSSLE